MINKEIDGIIEKLPYAFAYHEIITDHEGKAVDYKFISVNDAFEKMTGLKKDDIIQRKVTDVLPAIKESDFDWISMYGKVAASGESISMKQFSEALHKWYDVTAFSDQPGYFGTLFREITQDVVEKTALQEIVEISEQCLQHLDKSIDYNKITEAVKSISGAMYAVFNLYNEEGTAFTTVSISGVARNVKDVVRILGFNPIGKKWQHDYARDKKISANEITEFNRLSQLTGDVIDPHLVGMLESLFNVGKIYVSRIMRGDAMLGDFTIMMPAGQSIQNFEYVKILAGLIGQYLERQKTQNQLLSKTEELENFFDVNLDLLCIADTDGNFIRLNRAWSDILGYSITELKQKKFFDFIHPDDLPSTLAVINKLEHQEQVLSFTNRYRAKDGTYRYIEWRSHPKGKLIYAAARDVTERRMRENQLRESEQRFRIYTEKAPVGVFVANSSGKYTMVNQMACQMTGYTEQELLERTLLDFLAPEFVDAGLSLFEETVQSGQVEGEILALRKNGERYWVSLSATRLNDEEIIGFVQDITDRKQMLTALQSSNDRFDELARQSRTITWTIDDQGLYTDINPVVKDIFGYDPAELVGKVHFYDLFSDVDKEMVKNKFFDIFSRKEPFVNFVNATLTKDNAEVIVSTNGMPVLSEDGKLKGYNGSDTDITERIKMEEQSFLEQEKFKTILMSVGDAIIATDARGQIAVMNAVAENLTEWTQAEALGRPLDDVFQIIHEYTKVPCVNPAKQVLLTGEVIELENHTALVTKTGKVVPIEDSAAPVKGLNGLLTGVVIVFRDYTEKRDKQREVEYLSFHDHLTGLYNRRYLEDALNRLDTARNLPFSIIAVDVNGLKLTNDAYGHDMGDQLLITVADILKNACRSDDIIARTGGDEFVILHPKTNGKQADSIRRRINTLAAQAKLDSVVISLAVGYAVKTESNQSIREIMKQADNRMYKNKLKYGKIMRSQTIETVLRSINNKYDNEQIHIERVSQYCVAIARTMGFDAREIEEIKAVGVLHDIGKITVSPEILNKEDKLTMHEWEEIKRHPVTGYNILKAVDEYTSLADSVLYHHERWDGKGYPSGIKATEIPLYSRIICVADAYEAMTAQRSYQKTKTKEEAIAELRLCAGKQFDADIVKVFVENVLK